VVIDARAGPHIDGAGGHGGSGEGGWCYISPPGPDGWVSAHFLSEAGHPSRVYYYDEPEYVPVPEPYYVYPYNYPGRNHRPIHRHRTGNDWPKNGGGGKDWPHKSGDGGSPGGDDQQSGLTTHQHQTYTPSQDNVQRQIHTGTPSGARSHNPCQDNPDLCTGAGGPHRPHR